MSRERVPAGAVGDFDFLVGEWRVHHRCLIGTEWQEFDGVSMQRLLGGQANIDENSWTTQAGSFRALTVRTFDAERSEWSIFWLDTRWPTTFGPPVVGGFDGPHGLFFGDDTLGDRPIRVRFDWFVDSADACRWEQAYSHDDDESWQTNWQMHFARDEVHS